MIFGADMSSLVQWIKNIKIYIVKGAADNLDDAALTAEKEYSINFTEELKKFCLRLPYNVVNSFAFVNDVEIYQFKAKDSLIHAAWFCLSNFYV